MWLNEERSNSINFHEAFSISTTPTILMAVQLAVIVSIDSELAHVTIIMIHTYYLIGSEHTVLSKGANYSKSAK